MSHQLTVSQAVEGYVLDKRIELAPATLENYSYALRKLLDFLPQDSLLDSVTPRQITDLLDHYSDTLSQKSLLNVHAVLSSLWTWATAEGFALDHILRRVPSPTPERRAIVPFSKDDVEGMLEACRRSRSYQRPGQPECANARPTALRDRAIVLTLLDTGIRATELCRLAIQDLDANNNRLKVFGKGARERIVRVGRRTLRAIWRYSATREDPALTVQDTCALDDDPLFASSRDEYRRLDRYALYKLVRHLGDRAGVVPHAHPHRFRHTFAINFLRNGGDVYSLQALLGHATLDMVKRYLALAQTDTENAHRRASPVDNWRL